MTTAEGNAGRSARATLFTTIWFDLGWSRYAPDGALAIIRPLVSLGPLTEAELGRHLMPTPKAPDLGWDSTAWEPLDEYTDEGLRRLREQFDPTPFAAGPDEPTTAAEVMAEEAQLRRDHIADVDSWSQQFGLEPVRTLRDLLRFLLAAGVLTKIGSGTEQLIRLNDAAPLPAEILSLSEADRRTEDAQRWQELHEPAAQAVIDLFDPHGEPMTAIRTSLQRLARQTGRDLESVRAGVLNLLEDGDFVATADVERLLEHQVFELSVDWDHFHNSRISITRERAE
ncbi:DUF6042 family protein [Kribbella sp. NPDC059898]|uniref:DUF6042 family protein n=1 Tax=Kribbella sp. NPDC059898 TaxID=3346995 RepID=UPI0036503B26